MKKKHQRAMQWMVNGGTYRPCTRTVSALQPGAYTCSLDYQGTANFQARELKADDLIDFPDSLPSKILEEIDRFWTLEDRFREHGFLHRRGYLLYGKQGCGKSSLIHQILTHVVAQGNLAFFCENPHQFVGCIEQFRVVEPDRPIVCIFEDVDAIIERFGDSELLQWLDGNHQIDKAINLASTNYPEKLDRRIIARPRRFDRVLRIKSPDAKLRQGYFARKLPQLTTPELERWVELSEGLTFAALAEMIISVCCLENDLEDAAKLLRELDNHNPDSTEFADEGAEQMPLSA